MNIVIWIITGGLIGWAALNFMEFNRQRGAVIAVIIGAVAAFFGGFELAPLVLAKPGDASAFNGAAMMVAASVAAVAVFASDKVYERFGF